MRIADSFGRAFSNVSGSQFSWVKLLSESSVVKVADVSSFGSCLISNRLVLMFVLLLNYEVCSCRTLNRLQHLVVHEAENCCTIAHMEHEGGVSPRIPPLAQVCKSRFIKMLHFTPRIPTVS